MAWFEVELVFVADLCAVCFRRTKGCECSWERAAGKEQNWFGSEFSEEQDGREWRRRKTRRNDLHPSLCLMVVYLSKSALPGN